MSRVSKICIKCNVDFRPHMSNAKRNFTGLCGHCSRVEKNKARAFHNPVSKKLFSVWKTIKARCLNPKHKSFEYYSSKGICSEWIDSFQSFYLWSIKNGYSLDRKLHIDRIDNSKGYSPENCQWLTVSEHMSKDKGKKVFHIESGLRFESMRQASRFFGITAFTVNLILKGKKKIHGISLVEPISKTNDSEAGSKRDE